MAAPASTVSTAGKVYNALTRPLSQRCSDLEKIFDESSAKDLHTVFPHLLEHVFGFNNQPGWSVNRVMQSSQSDYHNLKMFLGPQGTLMKLVYRLLSDEMFKYDFPIQCLPHPTQHLIEEGAIPLLYINKLQFYNQGQTLNMLSLNAFELFMFHMAYLLVNPLQKTNWTNPGDTLFAALIDEYLNYFLPLNKNAVPPIANNSTPIRSPLPHGNSPLYRHSLAGAHSPLSSPSGLLRHHTPRGHATTNVDYLGNETWRSETFIQILCEFWLNQNSGGSSKQGIVLQAAEHVMPTVDHVRIVRMVVKHIHYFANSARSLVIVPSYQSQVSTPLEEFKKSVLVQIVQKKIYAFFRHSFDRWPLDSSFRLVLETWLSYIQPWRYTDIQQSKDSKEERVTSIDSSWATFVNENLLFYTNLFHELLARVFRMDLTSPKNAYMLFRVTKVFSLPNLGDLLHEAEGSLYDSPRGHPHPHDMGASYLSPGSGGRGSPVSPHIFELEGPNFMYQPLFGVEIRKSIEQLLQITAQASSTIATMNKGSSDADSSILSWLGLGAMVDYNASKFITNDVLDDYNVGDAKKLAMHLEVSINNLCEFFKLERPHDIDSLAMRGTNGTHSSTLHPELPDTTSDGCQLTPLGRYQLINGLRKFNVSYSGDPDLQPIRTFESAVCVRFLHKVSSFLNEKYSTDIKQLCSRQDFIGRMADQYFAATPTDANSPNSSFCQLEPKISLRFLAKKQTLCLLAICYLMMYMWFGTGVVGYSIILICLGLLYGVLGAAMKTHPRQKTS